MRCLLVVLLIAGALEVADADGAVDVTFSDIKDLGNLFGTTFSFTDRSNQKNHARGGGDSHWLYAD
jgi:hypothetical protein